MQVNIAKPFLSLLQISMQLKLLKCTETMSWLSNDLGMLYDSCMILQKSVIQVKL